MKTFLSLPLLLAATTHSAEVNYTGVTGGEWVTDSNWITNSYPTSNEFAALDTTANLSVEAPNAIRAIRIGTDGIGTLNIGSQATLNAGSSAQWDSHIGNGSGNQGTVKQEGGTVEINELEIGRNSSTGTYHIHSGSLTIIRALANNSLYLGTDDSKNSSGNGTFIISSGQLATRSGVYLGSSSGGIGRFEVIGSHPSFIGIGSDSSLDGTWTQNTGSTLSVRIDKTLQGITPIFVDEVGGNGGGDVIFESGALLDVDFTAEFLNGGTFTVMEWEGDVTDNGLQFAPSVDTNIWSFNIDAANQRLTVTAAGNPISRNFVHPGLSHKLSDLERMRDMVAAGIEPYATTFQQLSSHPRAQHTILPGNAPSFTELSNSNNNFLRNDAITAYYNALMWMITGDSRHAEASIRVFTAWSALRRNTTSIPLETGRHWRLFEAAEIIQSTYPGWNPSDIQAFKDMLVFPGYSNTTTPTQAINNQDVTFYWRCYQGDPSRHGNQGLFCMRTVMAMGIFLDNEIMYDRGLRYLQGAPSRADDLNYPSGPPNTTRLPDRDTQFALESRQDNITNSIQDYGYNEVMHNLIWPNGQGQESSRDQSHALTGPGIISTMSEIAWNQGDDLYGHLDNRVLLGLEHYYRYNLSFENSFSPDQLTPWEPTVENGEFIQRQDRTGRWFSLSINPYLPLDFGPDFLERGQHNLEPVYEMNLAHFRDRMNVPSDDTKWLTRGFDLLTQAVGVEQEGTIGDFPTRGGLAFRRVSPGDPIRGFNNDVPDFAMNSLPATIEAENYDYFPINGEGLTYSDLTANNTGSSYRLTNGVDLSSASEGGFAVSSIEAGEWITYTVSPPATGNYDLSIRYASTAPGGTIQLSFDGNDATGEIAIPHGAEASTGASDWQDLIIATNVPLDQGVQQLRVNFGGSSNTFLLNSLTIDRDSNALLGQWNFNEGSGSVANDSSGNGHDGTVQNATWIESEGRRALDFNGNSSTVLLPGSAFEEISDQVSIAMWTYGDTSLPSQTTAFFAHNSNNQRILNIHLPFDNSQIFWDAPDRINQLATEEEFEGAWVHWVFTKNATSGIMNIFRNGEIWHSGTNRFDTINAISGARIGSAVNNRFYNGMIDEVQLYNIALSSNEVSELFESSSLVGLVGEVTVSTTQSESVPPVSSTDLAQTEFLSSSATGGQQVETRHAELFNGIIGDNTSGNGSPGVVRMDNSNILTVELDTSINTLGYDLSGITSIFGWNTASGGRSNQGYEIILTFVDGSTAILAEAEHWEPNDPASFWTTVSFASSTGSHMATGVKAISFDITERANAGTFVIGREFDIFGSPTLSNDGEQVLAGGESLDLFIASPTGTPGIDWDLYAFDSTLILDSSLTSNNPFSLNLIADTLPDFDNSLDQSWLFATAQEIVGAFNPNAFVVNSSEFEANNEINGGEFAIAQTGNELFFTFTAAEVVFTALEDWRLLNFGTSENTGIAADDFDADFDGISNLLEYATGLDPNDPSDRRVLEITSSSTNPDELEVRFNRIVDPALSYDLQGSDTLLPNDWASVFTAVGAASDTVIIPESTWGDEPRYFFRLQVDY